MYKIKIIIKENENKLIYNKGVMVNMKEAIICR